MNNVPSAIRTVKTPVLPPAEEESLGRLYDALIEAWDEDPTIYTDASEWPATTDEDLAALGAPLCDEESFQPGPEDFAELDDALERLEVERSLGITMRFV